MTTVGNDAPDLRDLTGLVLDPDALGPVLLSRDVRHTYSDVVVEQTEDFFVVRVAAFTPHHAGFTEEQSTVLGSRWWPMVELATTTEDVWPRGIGDLLPQLLAGHGPLALPFTDEDPRPAT